MIHYVWCLSEGGDGNLGLACTDDGLVLGRTPLIERQGERFVVRERIDIERLLRRAHATEALVDRIMPGLATVARARMFGGIPIGGPDEGIFRLHIGSSGLMG